MHRYLYNSRWNYWSQGPSDADVRGFNNRSGTNVPAVANLVASLKSTGLWSLLTAAFPMVGVTGTSQAANLCSSSNSLVYSTGQTHTSFGLLTNNGAGCRFFSGHTAAPLSFSYGIYVTQDPGGDRADIYSLSPRNLFSSIFFKRFGSLARQQVFGVFTGEVTLTSAAHTFIGGSRGPVSGLSRLMSSPGNATMSAPLSVEQEDFDATWVLGEQHSRTYGFVFMGLEMTDAQLIQMADIIKTFQTAMGR